jgi:glyoxylase-like metal-dependent hydrolase (beta-lactamase superfamily II)
MDDRIRSLTVGPLESNCFIISDPGTKEAFIADPGDEPDRIIDAIRSSDLNVRYLVCTHAHFDHVGAIPELKEATGAQIVLHKDEVRTYEASKDMAAIWGYDLDPLPMPDLFVSEGDELRIGDSVFRVFHTPGHSPGGICLYGMGVVITGDTLFAGSVGRTDFEGGDIQKLRESFKRLMALPGETIVLPGHGPHSTISIEQIENFFKDEFV